MLTYVDKARLRSGLLRILLPGDQKIVLNHELLLCGPVRKGIRSQSGGRMIRLEDIGGDMGLSQKNASGLQERRPAGALVACGS